MHVEAAIGGAEVPEPDLASRDDIECVKIEVGNPPTVL